MNKIFLIGNLTRDVEQTTTPTGISLAKFAIAVNRFNNSDKNNGEKKEKEADFFNIIAWRQLGDRCAQYLSKGKKVAVIGNLQIRNYDDREGNKRTAIEVVADTVEFLTPKNVKEETSNVVLEPVEDDDLPF